MTQPMNPLLMKLKQRVIEEIALRSIVEQMSEEGGIRVPQVWLDEVEGMRNFLLSEVKQLTDEEERTSFKGR